jgi:predicted RNA-binding protein associated with RNAse of E/G family
MSPGGTYDALGVERREGDRARTTFVEGRWWYATVYAGDDGTRRGTYVNVCTPVELFPERARYVDLHVDVVKRPGGEVRRGDDNELDDAVSAGEVPEPLAERAREVAASIENAL